MCSKVIDKENEIYTILRNAIIEKYPNASVSSVYLRTPPHFPYVSVIQTDSYEPNKYVDSSNKELFTTMVFQIDVYSDDDARKKTICKGIMQTIDTTLRAMNFRREVLSAVPNMADSTIYRLTARYKVLADENGFYGA